MARNPSAGPEVRPPATAADRPRWPALDSLRGIAVVAVVAYHLGHLDGGFLGVDLFFVLSGFLITSLLLDEHHRVGHVGLRGFWTRRARRLLPALAAVVALVALAAVVLGWPHQQRGRLAREGSATLVSVANWQQIAAGVDYWAPGVGPYRHAWSLSVEEQVYLLWPLVLVGCVAVATRSGRRPAAIVGAVALGLAAASTGWHLWLARSLPVADLSRIYLGTDTRVLAPLLGCALAAALHGRAPTGAARTAIRVAGAAGAAVLALLVASSSVADPTLYRWGLLPLASLASVALVAAGTTIGATDPLTGGLGRRSYGLYLWSWPVIVLVAWRWPTLSSPATTAIVLVVSAVGAELSLRLLEEPLRHRRGWATSVASRRAAWAGVGVAAVAGLVVVAATAVAPPPPVEDLRVEAATRPAVTVPPTTASPSPLPPTSTSPVPSGDEDPTTTAPSAPPVPPAPLRVAVVGDSVAWSLAAHLPDPLPPSLVVVDNRAITGCGLLAQVDGAAWEVEIEPGTPFVPVPGGDACREAREDADELALAGAPDVVVVGHGGWEQVRYRSLDGGEEVAPLSDRAADLVAERFTTRLGALVASGVRVVLLPWLCPGPTATDAQGDPAYVAWYLDVVERVAEGLDGVEVLQVPEAMCTADGPTPEAVAARPDGAHWDDPWPWTSWLPTALAP